MKKIVKAISVLLLCLLVCLSVLGCQGVNDGENDNNNGETEGNTDIGNMETKSNLLYGLGEPLISSNVRNFDKYKAIDLVGAIGAKSYRMWINPTDVFSGWVWNVETSEIVISSISRSTALLYHDVFEKLKDAGVEEITGLGNMLPVVPSTISGTGKFVPKFGSSDYTLFLNKVKLIWKTLASTFPEITVWEVGNETNWTYMVYPDGDMPYSEKAKINVDLMYYARLGVKEGNPQAKVITPGFAPSTYYYSDDMSRVVNKVGLDTVNDFMKLIYGHIESGNFPTGLTADTDPDNYFDGVAWHPYDLGTLGYANTNDPSESNFDIRRWVDANNRIYETMKTHGDEEKEVWLTEFGLTSKSTSLIETTSDDKDISVYNVDGKYYKTSQEYEDKQAQYVKEYFDAMQSEEMSYIHACHFFRLFGCTIDYSWNGFTVLYYGIFFEPSETLNRGYYPRSKAYTLQEIYGGSGDLKMYSDYKSVS